MSTINVSQALYGRQGNTEIQLPTTGLEYVPKTDPSFVMGTWCHDIVSWICFFTDPLYIAGPTGAGKTTAIKQIAARLGMPVYEITGSIRMEASNLIGGFMLRAGETVYQHGPLALAMQRGGWFLLNEMDLCDPSIMAGLNTILDGSPLIIEENGGEIIHPHPLFRFIATGNSMGNGDLSGSYSGIMRQNMALMDRFFSLHAEYLPAQIEAQLLRRAVPALPEGMEEKLIEVAAMVRALHDGEGVPDMENATAEITLSTRALVRWAKGIVVYEPLRKRGENVVLYALDRAKLVQAEPSTRLSIIEICQRVFGFNSTN